MLDSNTPSIAEGVLEKGVDMAKFIQYPYVGNNEYENNLTGNVLAYGSQTAYSVDTRAGVVFLSNNPPANSPTAVVCKIGSGVINSLYISNLSNTAILAAGGFAGYTSRKLTTAYSNTYVDQPYNDEQALRLGLVGFNDLEPFASIADAITEYIAQFTPEGIYNVTYVGNSAIVNGPSTARAGTTVTCYASPELGATILETGISVTLGGSSIPFTYSGGTITFTVPND